ncbi:hypothetical protein NAT51_03715 [Flavobacterium amniphilum]|uniref:hypothetical protein n=1 Tax=Flavobacterium amniphilum TaxID=1834035 RepID=UPI00202AB7D4|nr:hypothetical protein [Flavobacterium amniphilum]MCL9804614.1 hypothetical protein [Flavobacterium amniphilum]
MIETQITILVNRKTDIDIIKESIIDSEIQFPVYMIEYESYYQIRFESDYEEWELDDKILNCFPEYEFTDDLEKGRKEIRLIISRYQCELSTDGWGRRIQNPLDETKYLIKKSIKKTVEKTERFNPEIKILFNKDIKKYFINIVDGIDNSTGEKGFLLLDDFKTQNESNKADIFKDHLYKSPSEAFQYGYYKMQKAVNQDFAEHIALQKKKIRELHKIPRKIVRDFINSCNKSKTEEILKNLDQNVIFEKRINWQVSEKFEGIENFKNYIVSQNQDLCAKNFKIRSSWDIRLPIIEIGVKYYPTSADNDNSHVLQYRRISFELSNNKIISIKESL